MKKTGTKKTALLLTACLLLGLLAGCKKSEARQLSATVYVPEYLDLDLDLELEYINGGCTDGENLYLIGQVGHDTVETDPYSGETYTGRVYTYDLYRVPLDGGAVEKLPDYVPPSLPEGREGSAWIESIAPGADGTLWVTERTWLMGSWRYDEKYADPEVREAEYEVAMIAGAAATVSEPVINADPPDGGYDGGDNGEYYEDQELVVRRRLDARGNELERVDLSNLEETLGDLLGEDAWFVNSSFDGEGRLYAVASDKIHVLSPRLELLFSLDNPDTWYEPMQLGDGRMGIQKRVYGEKDDGSDTVNKLMTIDPETRDWGPEYVMPNNVYSFYPGGGDYLFYYAVGDAIFGWKAGASGDGAGERLFSWIEADINSDSVRDFYFLPDGRVAAALQDWTGGDYPEISAVVLTATPREELPEKTTLIYGTLSLDYDVRRRILEFNRKSATHRIEVRDYSEFVVGSDESAAVKKLNTEIIASAGPDILDTSGLPVQIYGARGILADLWPFIEADPELGRDALMTRPLEANELGGKLYEVFGEFSIRTVAGPSNLTGDRMSWTLADLQAALAQMPDGCSIFGVEDTRGDMLETILRTNLNHFVDWDTGKCSFDSEDFQSLLAFCGGFPKEFNWENVDWDDWEEEEYRLLTGKQMLQKCYLRNFSWSFLQLPVLFPEGYAFVGYPKEDGGVGSCFTIGEGTAICAACKDQEGAWSFVREVLLPQSGDNYVYFGRFPVNKADFDQLLDQALNPPEYELDGDGNPWLDGEGNPVPVDWGYIWLKDGTNIPLSAPRKEDVDRVMALYNAVDAIDRYDEKIFAIVKEVAGSYFAGDRTAESAAALIQNRVKLYVGEQR